MARAVRLPQGIGRYEGGRAAVHFEVREVVPMAALVAEQRPTTARPHQRRHQRRHQRNHQRQASVPGPWAKALRFVCPLHRRRGLLMPTHGCRSQRRWRAGGRTWRPTATLGTFDGLEPPGERNLDRAPCGLALGFSTASRGCFAPFTSSCWRCGWRHLIEGAAAGRPVGRRKEGRTTQRLEERWKEGSPVDLWEEEGGGER
jgi:hypothetical protein